MVSRLEKWERASEWPLLIAAVVFLVAYSWEVIADLTGLARTVTEWLMSIVWVCFAVDVAIRLRLTDDRLTWVRKHPLDLASVLLPVLRPLRALQLIAVINVFWRSVGRSLRGRITAYTVCSAALLIWVASLAVLDAERDAPGATITTVPEAVWWAFTTVTTVGYGDLSPVTATGRVIAIALMIGGITVLGVITATLASWIVSAVSDEEAEKHAVTREVNREQVADLQAEIQRLREQLTRHGQIVEEEPPDSGAVAPGAGRDRSERHEGSAGGDIGQAPLEVRAAD